jgi:hypothetical protein
MIQRCFRHFATAVLRPGAALPLLLLGPASAQAQIEDYPSQERYVVRLEYREFRPGLDGEITHGSGATDGTPVDLDRDLAIGDKRTFELRGAIQIRRGHKIRGSYTPLDYAGEVPEARRTFTYGGTEYQRFDRVLSTFKGGYYGASYEWDFVRGSRGYLGAVLGARMLDIDAVVAAPERGLREFDTLRTPVPVLGGATRLYAGRVSLEGELVGFTLGSKGKVWELETSARMHISDRLAVQGGYRRISIKGEDGADSGEIKFKGWQFGLELSL